MAIINDKILSCDDQLSAASSAPSISPEVWHAISKIISRISIAFNLLHNIFTKISFTDILDFICDEADVEVSCNLCTDSWDQAFANTYLLSTSNSVDS